jgi:ribosomal protein S18 acetylase RimI-like enzyme
MTPSAQIRQAILSDIEPLIALSRRTISASYRSFLGDEAVAAFIGSGAVDQYVAQNMERCSVILVDGKIVGYSVCKDNLIDLMMIDDGFHRRGLGTRLLEHAEATLFRSYSELTLESFEGNQKANNFYHKNGWVEANRYFDQDSGVNKIVFHKRA